MPFPFDKYPWLNFQELNLAYFIKHFREIFQQWDELYHDLTAWKDATDEELAEWKNTVELGLSAWKTGVESGLDQWELETTAGLETWKTATLAALNDWQTAFETLFNSTFSDISSIKTDAEAARDAAAASAAAAAASAASVSGALAQISENAADIARIDPIMDELYNRASNPGAFSEYTKDGSIYSNNKWQGFGTDSHVTIPIKPGDSVNIEANAARALIYGVLVNDLAVENELAEFSTETGFTARLVENAGRSVSFTAPADARYLYITASYSNQNYVPAAVTINGIDFSYNIRAMIGSIQTDLESVETRIGNAESDIDQNAEDISANSAAHAALSDKLYADDVHGFVEYNLASTDRFSVNSYANHNVVIGNSSNPSYPKYIRMDPLNNFTSYAFFPNEEITVACDRGSAAYYAIAILEGPATHNWYIDSNDYYLINGLVNARYRSSDNNLPTENSPLTIPAGSVVVVSITAGATPNLSVLENIESKIIKPQNLGQNYPLIEAEMISSGGSEYMYYYLPTNSGKWIRYKFNHFVSAATNADGWVQREVDLVSADKSNVIMPLVAAGEWEMAVMLTGRGDFIGCQNHGSEVSTLTNFYFDGIGQPVTNGFKTTVSEIKITEKSTMYDPADEVTVVGYHYKEYIITYNGIKIHQRIDWIVTDSAGKSYVAMLPAVRGNDPWSAIQVTDRAYDGYHFDVSNTATATFDPNTISSEIYRGNEFNIYGTSSKVSMTMKCDIVNRPASSFAFLSHGDPDHNIYYSKWYCAYCGGDNQAFTITAGDTWEWTSEYHITYTGR